MIVEILTFGQMASLFENLKDTEEKKAIAEEFGTVVPLLESWLKALIISGTAALIIQGYGIKKFR